jgi:hypothetical protein
VEVSDVVISLINLQQDLICGIFYYSFAATPDRMEPLATSLTPRKPFQATRMLTEKNRTNPELETPTRELPITFHLKARRSL